MWVAAAAMTYLMGTATSAAPQPDLGCKGNPSLIGQCYTIRGMLNLSADRAFVLWPDDAGRRPVVVRAAPNSNRDWPTNLVRAMTNAAKERGFVKASVHGVFQVCPIPSIFPDRPEEPYGCIQSADHLTTDTTWRRK